jgi:hypothetical protein
VASRCFLWQTFSAGITTRIPIVAFETIGSIFLNTLTDEILSSSPIGTSGVPFETPALRTLSLHPEVLPPHLWK